MMRDRYAAQGLPGSAGGGRERMKHLVILGAGTAGTIVANRMRRRLSGDWSLTIVDPGESHLYQPGLLFLPFGAHDEGQMLRPRARTLRSGIKWRRDAVIAVEPAVRVVSLASGEHLPYDLLVIASGARIKPDDTPGLAGSEWHRSIHDFYTLEGAQALRSALASFPGGRLVLNVVEMPIKCPVAPMEFLFLADEFFTRRGIRHKVDLVYVTPLDGAFTKPVCNKVLSYLIAQKGIRVETEFNTGEVEADGRKIKSFDDREVAYDLLVSIPTHGGADFVDRSGLGDELGFVPTHPNSLRSKADDHIFVLGDATDLPTSKAGSVAHFQAEVLEGNLVRAISGVSLDDGFDGHANCFVETGFGKALLIDFNYDTEPLPGTYPIPRVGPMRLLKESRINHFGKLAFRWMYWHALLPGTHLPVPTRMSMAGKHPAADAGGPSCSANTAVIR
jgi:sulfide:quinone oxidoreductase